MIYRWQWARIRQACAGASRSVGNAAVRYNMLTAAKWMGCGGLPGIFHILYGCAASRGLLTDQMVLQSSHDPTNWMHLSWRSFGSPLSWSCWNNTSELIFQTSPSNMLLFVFRNFYVLSCENLCIVCLSLIIKICAAELSPMSVCFGDCIAKNFLLIVC